MRRAGGLKRHVTERCLAIAATGMRPIVLDAVRLTRRAASAARSHDGSDEEFPNLRFDTRAEFGRPRCVPARGQAVFGRTASFHRTRPDIARAGPCARRAVRRGGARLCVDLPSHHPDRRRQALLRRAGCRLPAKPATRTSAARSKRTSGRHGCGCVRESVLAGARRVVVPSARRREPAAAYFPRPHLHRDAMGERSRRRRRRMTAAAGLRRARRHGRRDRHREGLRVPARLCPPCRRARLGLEFVVVGHTCDDKRLLDTGVVHITGPYDEAEAVELIRSQQAQLGFLPSLWPETWSYTLSQMWQAGLEVVAFDWARRPNGSARPAVAGCCRSGCHQPRPAGRCWLTGAVVRRCGPSRCNDERRRPWRECIVVSSRSVPPREVLSRLRRERWTQCQGR